MREYETVLLEAELMAMSPEMVATFLKNRAVKIYDSVYWDAVDEGVEQALRRRDHPLINLALARYARHIELIDELFQSSDPGSPIRLGCLANRSVATSLLSKLPEALFGRERVSNWFFYAASYNEICALLKNPTLSDSFLIDLLGRRNDFRELSDEKLLSCVSMLCYNPRFRSPMESDYIEVLSEWPDDGAIGAAWRLAGAAPVTKSWALSLGYLYDQLRPSYSIADPLTLAQRWCLDSADLETSEEVAGVPVGCRLSSTQQVRKCLAKLALKINESILSELLTSDDIAYRCAAYSSGALSGEHLSTGWVRDRDMVFFESLGNDYIWKHRESRLILRQIAWHPRLWGIMPLNYHINAFESREKYIRNKHPEWLVDER